MVSFFISHMVVLIIPAVLMFGNVQSVCTADLYMFVNGKSGTAVEFLSTACSCSKNLEVTLQCSLFCLTDLF
jgi:hypothetical protein